MRFAVSLLAIIAIASIIGTVLKQNEPYNNYLNQFGQFWFPVFDLFGLYSVYGSGWFLLLLAFLVISTSACLIRQTPGILREMRGFREQAREVSLRQFGLHAELDYLGTRESMTRTLEAYLREHGYRFRSNLRTGATLFAAKSGSWHRTGYWLAHGAIVTICLGGLADGNLPLKLRLLLGDKVVTQGNQAISAIPESARLAPDNPSFRGNLFIPEGQSQSLAVLNVRDGILLQELPFSVSLKRFVIDHYATGAPKRFASEILLTDRVTGQSFEHVVEVNHPVTYRGITLYQASFDDGGTRLNLVVQPLDKVTDMPRGAADTLHGVVGESSRHGDYTIEFTGFRALNVEPLDSEPTQTKPLRERFAERFAGSGRNADQRRMANVGPSFSYKLRDASGQAKEFNNYMLPISIQGHWWLLTGVRENPNEPFRYLRLPLDAEGRIDTFLAMRTRLFDSRQHRSIAQTFARRSLPAEATSETVQTRLADTAQRTLQLFAEQGFESVGRFIEANVPAAEREQAAEVFVKLLEGCAWQALLDTHAALGRPAPTAEADTAAFLRASLTAMSDSLHYPAPFWLQLSGYDEVKASVLQATRSPGMTPVFIGCALLTVGVLIMLYGRERRLFLLVQDGGKLLVAMSAHRKSLALAAEFDEHTQRIARLANSGFDGSGPSRTTDL